MEPRTLARTSDEIAAGECHAQLARSAEMQVAVADGTTEMGRDVGNGVPSE